MPDCAYIRSEIAVYEAAITVDQASLTVAQNQLASDQAAYSYWLLQAYQNGCTSGAPEQERTLDLEDLKTYRLTVEKSKKELMRLQKILDKKTKIRDRLKGKQ